MILSYLSLILSYIFCNFAFHGQPFSRAQFSTSRWPPSAANAHVHSSHGHPFAPPAPRGGHHPPRTRTSSCPTGSRSPLQHLEVATLRSARTLVTDIHSYAPTSTSRWPLFAANARLVPRAAVRTRPSAPRGGRSAQYKPRLFHGQPFARAHFSTSRRPDRPRPTRPLVPRAAVRARPLQYLEVPPTFAPSTSTRLLVPRAAVRARPLQYLETAVIGRGRIARPLVPRAAVRTLASLEVAVVRAVAHVSSSHGHPFARAHFST